MGAIAKAALAGMQLEEVTGALVRAGVTPILLKGAALQHWLYDRDHPREIVDFDLLVREEEIPRARRALEEIGYPPDFGPHAHAPATTS